MSRAAAWRREEGTASIEVVGLLPLLLIMGLITVQVVMATVAINATNQAVRDGARAQSLGHSVSDAVDRSLPGGFSAESLTVDGTGRVTLGVKVPRVAIFPEIVIRRTAVMP